jgi:hypothetical protein
MRFQMTERKLADFPGCERTSFAKSVSTISPEEVMKNLLSLGLVAATLVLVGAGRASAQQGVFITQASARLAKLVDQGNKDGYQLENNRFSLGGGWLKKGDDWVSIYSVHLTADKAYRFLASGDNDAMDVDLRVLDRDNKVVALDDGTEADAVVNFTPKVAGKYFVQIRLYSSRKDFDAVCISALMVK